MKKRNYIMALTLLAACFGSSVICGCGDDEATSPVVEPNGGAGGNGSGGNTSSAGGHEYVDLGLPSGTLWATCNVGASKPEEYGDFFAWGETKPKSSYSWNTYKYYNNSNSKLTKYNTDSNAGTVDNKTVLETADDAATANWGADWRMPSKAQCQELCNSSYTTTTWTTQNGIKGKKITSKSNGKSIFLPAAGYRGESQSNTGSTGGLWSLSHASTSGGAYCLYFASNSINLSPDSRAKGRSIRPVRVQTKQ